MAAKATTQELGLEATLPPSGGSLAGTKRHRVDAESGAPTRSKQSALPFNESCGKAKTDALLRSIHEESEQDNNAAADADADARSSDEDAAFTVTSARLGPLDTGADAGALRRTIPCVREAVPEQALAAPLPPGAPTDAPTSNRFFFRLMFPNVEPLYKFAAALTKTPFAFVKLVAVELEPGTTSFGFITESRRDATSDSLIVVSSFSCTVQGGMNVDGTPLSPEQINSFTFYMSTRDFAHCIKTVKSKDDNLVTATLYDKFMVDGTIIEGGDAGLVWESSSSDEQVFMQCSQPIAVWPPQNAIEYGCFFETPKLTYEVMFQIEVKNFLSLLASASRQLQAEHTSKKTKDKDESQVTLTLQRARQLAPRGPGAASGSASGSGSGPSPGSTPALTHWALSITFYSKLVNVPISQTMYLTMKKVGTRSERGPAVVSKAQRDAMTWDVVCKNTYPAAPVKAFLASCGAELVSVCVTTLSSDKRPCMGQPLCLRVEQAFATEHFFILTSLTDCDEDEVLAAHASASASASASAAGAARLRPALEDE